MAKNLCRGGGGCCVNNGMIIKPGHTQGDNSEGGKSGEGDLKKIDQRLWETCN